jgi:metal-dependent amidase/aminoacylase/carboxypeptidase family protein
MPPFAAEAAVSHAAEAASSAVGRDKVSTDFNASLGCEDFAHTIQAAAGAYTGVETGAAAQGEGLHGDRYVFNDNIVPIMLRYWVSLVEQSLSAVAR